MRFVLASASPRRKELLRELIPSFEIVPARSEEKTKEGLSPEETVEGLAAAKAREVFFSQPSGEKIVLGADTVVVFEGKILGKPKSEEEAKSMLSSLSGRTHYVLTGVCFVYTDEEGNVFEETSHERTDVVFEKLEKEFIERYVAGGSPMDKAGAYGIQDGGLVKEIVGSYSNVVGLPTELCAEMMKKIRKQRENS